MSRFKSFVQDGTAQEIAVHAAGSCAMEQGEKVFERYFFNFLVLGSSQRQSREPWLDVGRAIGVPDTVAFKACVRSRQYNAAVSRDTREGEKYLVDGTPTSFVDGVRVVGSVPIEGMDSLIAAIMRGR
jgi:protein-disulfide isomerase